MNKPCPICGKPLEQIYEGILSNAWVCRNNGNCKGWYCNACDEYHPYGTSCAVQMVHDVRRGTNDSLIRELELFIESLNGKNKTVTEK